MPLTQGATDNNDLPIQDGGMRKLLFRRAFDNAVLVEVNIRLKVRGTPQDEEVRTAMRNLMHTAVQGWLQSATIKPDTGLWLNAAMTSDRRHTYLVDPNRDCIFDWELELRRPPALKDGAKLLQGLMVFVGAFLRTNLNAKGEIVS